MAGAAEGQARYSALTPQMSRPGRPSQSSTGLQKTRGFDSAVFGAGRPCVCASGPSHSTPASCSPCCFASSGWLCPSFQGGRGAGRAGAAVSWKMRAAHTRSMPRCCLSPPSSRPHRPDALRPCPVRTGLEVSARYLLNQCSSFTPIPCPVAHLAPPVRPPHQQRRAPVTHPV